MLGITGSVVGGTNCAAAQTGNQGCGVRASQTNSFGAAFNAINGGVYASMSPHPRTVLIWLTTCSAMG